MPAIRRFKIATLATCLLSLPTLVAQERYASPINRSILRAPVRASDTATKTDVLASVTAAEKAVVHVYVEIQKRRNSFKIERPSSGVFVDPSGLLLTFWSLVEEAFEDGKLRDDRKVRVQTRDGKSYDARLLGKDASWDLALLKVDAEDAPRFPSLELADSDATRPGDSAIVLSYHDGKEAVAFRGVVARPVGSTMHRNRELEPNEFLITDAAIQLRSHGGALIDARRRLLGLVSAEHVSRQIQEPTLEDILAPSYGFVIPSNLIRTTLADAARKAKPSNASLLRKPPSTSAKEPIADAVEKVAASIVGVYGGNGELPKLGNADPYGTKRRASAGSGVVVTATGLVLTNAHFLAGSTSARVTLPNGKTYPARAVSSSLGSNMTLIQVELPSGKSLQPIAIASAKRAILGETVVGVGNPTGKGNLTVSAGVLSAKRGRRFLQADPNLGNENGGGALIDLSGRLLGVIDGGRIDKRELAFRRRGERAKLQNNLSLVASIDGLLTQFPPLGDLTPAEDTSTGLRRTPVTRVADMTAQGLLNIYVSRSSRPKTDDDNPFAPSKPVTQVLSLGSGVVIDDSGLAISNWHVVDSATEPDGSMVRDHVVHARLRDGTTCEVEVLSISREDDLSLLRLTVPDGRSIEGVTLGDSDAVRIGETVIAIGNPEGRANSVTCGIASSKDRSIKIRGRWAKFNGLLETDAAINGGNSGGALLDLDGRLIGINSAGGGGLETTGFAIPVNYVRSKLLNLLLSPEKLRSCYVGMTWSDVDPTDGTSARGALRVTSVAPHGPAKRAGIELGDRIVSLDGDTIRWSVDLTMRLLERRGGQELRFAIDRDGKRLEKKVTCLSAPVWACQRQLGVELELVRASDEGDLVRDAAVAMHRKYANDPSATPNVIPESLVRVTRITREEDPLRKGDLLLGVELVREPNGSSLERFERVREVQKTVNDYGVYEGSTFGFWVYRNGKVEVIQTTAKRLFL